MRAHEIIKRPILTEKVHKVFLSDQGGRKKVSQYAFEVDRRANKHHIRSAVEELFRVEVRAVCTINVSGKQRGRTRRGKAPGRTRSYKKAIVTLKPGHTIDLL